MDRRKLLLILAVFVAVIGTALVFVYVQSADNRANSKYDTVEVLKATQNIAQGESYDTALAAGKLSLQPVPQSQLNDGYESSTTALKGKFAAGAIYPGQQIIAAQFTANNSSIAATSNLPIPKGMIAVTVQLSDPDRVAGNVYPGSHVAIFATGLGGPGHTVSGLGAGAGSGDEETALMLSNVLVLNVGDPVQASSTTTDEAGNVSTETLPRTLLTLAVDQSEAQKVILASKSSPDSLTFGLLISTSQIHKGPGTSSANLWK
ncbi:MAG TPA: Flp pilus assembly protein CpaB [Nocardioides sp.]|jgi:pilus assembly protein CpaB|uniref:Flp pilus assembly protein CpaB n=1 Tax=Nocardioides sp. TaxID=35761 RepID=UPI002E359A80|nr:Flp pilus assembly protein CpaB [Nocardioides sp.]HEX3930694.1 Flp pilus assembly protein CpaB [Nocardioides sp.]